jgi:hypothetical protein
MRRCGIGVEIVTAPAKYMAACGQSDVVRSVKERDMFGALLRQRFCQRWKRQLKGLYDNGVGSIPRNLQSAIDT